MVIPLLVLLWSIDPIHAEEPAAQRKHWISPRHGADAKESARKNSRIDQGLMRDLRGASVTRVGVRTRIFTVRDGEGGEHDVTFQEASRIKRDGRIAEWRDIRVGDRIERIRYDSEDGTVVAAVLLSEAAASKADAGRVPPRKVGVVEAVGLETQVVILRDDGGALHKGEIGAKTKVYLRSRKASDKNQLMSWTALQEGDVVVEVDLDEQAEQFRSIVIQR